MKKNLKLMLKSGVLKVKKVMIIEDNKAEVEALTEVVKRVDSQAIVESTDSIGTALEYAVANNVSLFIVDIVLFPEKRTDTSGIDFVETIRNMPQYKFVPVIFVSSLKDPRLYAYRNLHCYSYIQKPLLYSEMEPVVREALEFKYVIEDEKPLRLRQDKVLYIIKKQDIIYASSKASKMTIVTDKERYGFYYLSCNELMEQLDSEKFIKCSRNSIVNKEHIAVVDRNNNIIRLRGCKDIVKIGKIYRKEFLKEIDVDAE